MNKPNDDLLKTLSNSDSNRTFAKKEDTKALLSKLRQASVRIALGENDKLKIRAPKGALTDEFKKDLKQSKNDIIDLLKAQAGNKSAHSSVKLSSAKGRLTNIPLSFTQERLWFLDQLEGASNLYNMPGLFHLAGTIHLEQLKQAFEQIIQRHDVLRTHFLTQNGKGFAQILPTGQWQLEQHDLSNYSEEETKDKSEAIIRAQLASSFDLTKECLLRTLLIKQSNDTSILMLNMHHIISDGWSVQVLIREFISLYSSFIEGQASQLDALPIQYADYAHWQRNHLKGDTLEESLNYWRKQLKDVQVLELPTDFQRPAVQTSKGALHTFSLENQLIQQLKDTAQEQGVTLFMVLLAGLSLLLSRYSNQDDICIGSPIANRNRKELQDLIGFFANTLVFRQKIVPGQTVNEFLQIIKKNTVDAYEYQETPFEKVVDGLNIERSLGHSPLFQVMLVLQNIAQEKIELPGMEIENISFDSGSAKFDLTFTVEEAQSAASDEPVAVSIEYNTKLFKQETIAKLSNHLTSVLEAIAHSSEQEVAAIEFLSDSERQQQLSQWQREPVIHKEFLSVQQMFETQVESTPDATALIFADKTLSYQELNAQANQLAHLLQSKGIGAGQAVGICLNRSIEMIVSLYGVLKSGASYIPMDVNYPKERLLYMLSETDAPLLITNQSMQEKLSLDTDKVFLADLQWHDIEEYGTQNIISFDQRNDPLYTIFTSGSTGQPKGARVRHSGELNLLPWYTSDFGLEQKGMTEQDNILLMSAFGFDLTQKNLFAPLVCGATLVIPEIEHYDHKYLIQAIKDNDITWLNCAPSAFYPIVENQNFWSEISTLRYVFLGGEPINLQKVSQWEKQCQCKLVNSYGPTECTDIASFHILDSLSLENKNIPIGLANDNVQLYILNEQKQLIPEGHVGELYIGGQGVGLGYINQPKLTQEKFIKNPFNASDDSLIYQTGDLVRYQSNGVIEYVGRTDFQVKLRGLRIELGEIEYHLGQLDGITDGVVRIVKDNNDIEQLVAYIVREVITDGNIESGMDKDALDKEKFREALIDNLPEYMVPNHYIEMDVIPLTPNGKVDNKALPALEIKSSEENYQTPETAEEKILCQIWMEFLCKKGGKIEKIGTFDNFFEMGGDSILSIQIISRANDEGLVLQPRDIFEHQNIARLALHAQSNAQKQNETVLTEQGILSGDILLSPVQSRFLQQNFTNKDHWNQSILLSVSKKLNLELLNQALNLLVFQHDVLHSHFTQSEQDDWIQTYNKPLDLASLIAQEKISYSSFEGAGADELNAISNTYQTSLSIEEGRMLQAVLFESETEDSSSIDSGSIETNRLLIIIHHLVIDGISWRVLFSDLQKICNSLVNNEGNIVLPAKKSSYRQWTKMLSEYSHSDELLQEIPFWRAQAEKGIMPLPVDYDVDSILMKDSVFLSQKLSEEQTQQLLLNVNSAYNTEINDILLAGLLLAINNWSGNKKIAVALEGHGRETLSDSIDIANTTGWFTSVFPVLLELDNGEASDIQALLKSVKEQLRLTPNKGVGYSVLRYLSSDKEMSQSLVIDPQISFNYLGQSDNTFADSEFFDLADEPSGHKISPDNHHPYLLDLNCVVVNGCLRLDWTFSGKHFNQSTVENLAQSYNDALQQIISHCLQPENTAYTPSDFPLTQINEETRLTQKALDSLCDTVAKENESIEDIYPLSPMQKGMLFHSAFDAEKEMYIEQLQLNFTGEIELEFFEQAWQSVIARHSILRTQFIYQQGLEPLQIVKENVNCKIKLIHFEGWDEFHLKDFLKADRVRGFHLDNSPLMRLHMLKLDERNLFVWTFHHLLADGWSTALILQEVLHTYQSLILNDASKNTVFKKGIVDEYKEFIHYLLIQDKQAEETYWKKYLNASDGQAPSATDLPLTSSYFDASNMGEVKKLKLNFSTQKTEGLTAFSKKYHLTINTLVQGLWGLLLGKYSHTNDVQFGVVVSGRPTDISGIDNKVGLFINSLPMRICINKDQATHEWFKGLQQQQIEHQLYHHSAINDIQHWVSDNGSVSAHDLFNHVFVFENYPVSGALSGDDLPLNVLDLEMVEKTNFPLTVSVTLSDRLAVEFGYDTKVYSEAAINKVGSQLEFLITSVLETPEIPVSELKWLSEAEEQHLLVELNQNEQEFNKVDCIHTTFEQYAEQYPEKTAVRDPNSVQLSYKQLNEKANQLAHYLLAQDVEAESIIGVCMERNSDMLVSLLAILKVGCAYVPMDPNYPEERLAFILEDSSTPVLLTQSHLLDGLPQGVSEDATKRISVDERGLLDSYSCTNPGLVFSSEHLAYIIYTSGSTGKPKGVMVRHRNVQNLCQWHQSAFVINEESRATQIANIAFDASAWEIWPYLLSGASLYLVDQQTVLAGNTLLDYYAMYQITHSFVPTPVAESLLQFEWSDDIALEFLLTGGDRLSGFDADKFAFEFVNNYGPTETTVVATSIILSDSTSEKEKLPPIGRPVSNTQIYVVDEEVKLVPMGVVGELLIGGSGVAKGYLNRPELTSEKFISNPFIPAGIEQDMLYRTGDLVRYRLDGNVEFVGRTDDQVKIRGYRIELGEITSNITRIEGIKEAIVVVKTDQQNTKRLVVFWVAIDGLNNEAINEKMILQTLSQDLPEYMVPSSFVELPSLPLTAHGKIDTRALPDIKFERSTAYQAAESEAEVTLLEIWSDVLKKDNIGVHDNFFELGGDSILSIQIISRASDTGLTLQPRDVFEYQTISELAQFAQSQAREVNTEQNLLEGQFELSPIQSWFFEQNFNYANHWNQSVLLSVTNKFDAKILNAAFNALVEHHDVLHILFETKNDVATQTYHIPVIENSFVVENLSQSADDLILEVALEIESRASQYQAQLDIEKGELFKAVLFVTDDVQANRLLIIAHHLIIDGVSWRILFADLQKACLQLLNHQPVELGNKGSSFRQWQQALSSYSHSDVLKHELNYWQESVNAISSQNKLVVDRESDVVITRDRNRIVSKLTQEQTRQLLEQVNSAYNTEANDILLSAMLLALNESRDLKTLTLMLEGHGRESIADNLDISKTVGWFTSMYPVMLCLNDNLSDSNKLSSTIKEVKEQLRSIPNNGIAYSALRYLHPDSDVRQSLVLIPEISFNYLGQTGNLFADNDDFNFAKESAGDSVSLDNQHPHLLDLSAIVIDGQLEISWVYSTRHFNQMTMDALSTAYTQILEQLIEHCLEPDSQSYTSSDFPLVESLEQDKLDQLVDTMPALIDMYPLSPLQEGMLFHSLYQQGEEVYIEQMSMHLSGELNVKHFEQAWNHVIQSHTILRTAFIAEQGLSPIQVVFKEAPCQIQVTNAENWTQTELDDFLLQDRQQGFDLKQPPLMRFNLLQQALDQFTFIWTSHHILADGWSFPLIILAVMEHYEALENQTPDKTIPVDEYKQFIHYLKQQDKQAEAQYWKDYLADVSGATALPYASHHYDSKNTGQNDYLSLDLSRSQTDALNALTQQYHVTISTLIQGLWSLLLSKYSGEKDILYGMTVSGRPSEIPGVEQKIGLYINSLPVKMTIVPELSLADWFEALQQQQVEHQNYHHSGLSDIQQYTGIAAEQLFNQLFVFENYPVSEALQNNQLSLTVNDVQLVEKTNYPLTITTHHKERLSIEFGFNTQVYPDPRVIENIAEHLGTLIDSVLAKPQAKVSELNWFSAQEQQKVVYDWNQTHQNYDLQVCLHEKIEHFAQQTPNQIAVVYKNESLSYQQLNEQANQLAHHLIEQGINTGDFVGLCAERSTELVVGLVAILKANAAYIPMDPEYPESRLKHILDDSQAKIILTQNSIQFKLSDYQGQIFCLDTQLSQLNESHRHNPALPASSEQAAYMIYTSGSTGLPKGVVCHHRGVVNLLMSYNRILPFEMGENHTLWTSISFDVSVHEFFSALITGGAIHLMAEDIRLDADGVFNYMAEKEINSSYLPPFFLSQYNHWVKANPGASKLKRLLVGVEPIVESLLIDIQNSVSGLQIINGYGPTEATICCSLYPVKSDQPSTLINTPIGKPVDNCHIYLLDEQGQPVPVGVNGEVTIGGSGITHGYWNKPELTAEKFVSNPYREGETMYRTGDMARYLPDGNIEFIGRTDNQVKLRGYRIEMGEIESQLRALSEVNESVVIIHQENDTDTEESKRLIAYVTLEENNHFDQNEIKVSLTQYLPDYMIPAAIITLDSFPLSPNGKIDKKALPEPEIEKNEYIAPQTEVQHVLADIWSEILNKDSFESKSIKSKKIGIKDNFFEIGGHSLLATQVITHINKHYAIELPIKALFDSPTIEQLASKVEVSENEELSIIKPTGIMLAVRRNEIPLSFSQERLWFIEQFDSSASLNNAYSIPVLIKLTGELNVQKLEAAFSTLVHRHQVLSSRFVTVDGEARQERQQPSPWHLEYDDYSHINDSIECDKNIQQRIKSEFERGFDISKGNLFRTILLKVSEQEYRLMIIMHHIISDGWSMSILVDEFTKLYSGIIEQQGSNSQPVQLLPRLPIQYADFSVWQRKWLCGDRLEHQLSYWTEQLQDVPVLELPTDYPRPSVQSFKGSEFTFIINKDINDKLNELSKQQGSTLFMTLMAGFSVLLNKYTRQKDICVGSPIANRNRKEIESLIGFFVNTLAIRQQVEPEQSFNQLLSQVKEQTLNAYDHQDLPFENIVDNLNVERNLSYSPIFQVMFILQNTPTSGNEAALKNLDGLEIEEIKLENNTAKFDLTFTCVETDEGLRTTIEYRSELFESDTIERMASYFENILTSVSQNSETVISDIDILSEEEKHQQLVTWQQPAVEHKPYISLQAMFEAQVVQTPDAIALRFADKSLTYSQLNEQANQFAHYLTQNGIAKGQSVGICLSRSLEMIVSLYGVIKTGASYIPMDINYPKDRLLYMLDETQSPLIITQTDLQEKLNIASDRVFLVDTQWSELQSMAVDNLPEQDLREEPLYTIFTSGSTGLPKGARVKHSGELNLMPWYIDDFNMSSDDNILLMSAFGFDLTQKNLFAPLMCGASLVIPEIDHYDNDYLTQLIKDEKISWLNCAPSAFYPLIENDKHWSSVSSLRNVFLGGEPISLHKVQSWNQQSQCQLVNSYGPTECTDIASYHVLDTSNEDCFPIGKANHNVQLYILNDELQLIPEGNIGELYIGGESLGLGYINQPELTAKAFIASPFANNQSHSELIYKTGDFVRYKNDGVIEYLGRVDSQVKLRGLRIELGEIEYQLLQNHEITDVAVRIVNDANEIEQLVAYIVPKNVPSNEQEVNQSDALNVKQLRNDLADHLPDYMLPNFIIELDSLPLTPNGKVDNKALPELSSIDNTQNYKAPETTVQLKLVEVWSNILGVSPIGCSDNFFNLGGNSLVAVRVLSQVNEAFSLQLTVKSLFEQPVLENFAAIIDEQTDAGHLQVQELITAAQRPDALPLSHAQNRLWFIEQMNPADAAYNISSALKITGQLDPVIVENVFKQVIKRHESLRTNFLNEQGEAVQVIHRSNQSHFEGWSLSLIDLSDSLSLYNRSPEEEALKRAELDATTPFSLSDEALFRVQLLKLSDEQFVLLFAMHHIISDGWSMQVLQRDFAQYYQSYLDDAPVLLPELSIQYADFSLWQEQKMDQQYIDSQLDFWKTYLKGIPNQLRLPTDYQRPAVATQNGSHYQFSIDNTVFSKLKEQAKEQQASLFMHLLSAWQILLAKYSEQNDICVGVPVSGREREEIKDLIGFFVNVIVIRGDLSLNPSFNELLTQTKLNTLDAFDHQAIPAEMVIDAVQPVRDTSHAPIVQVGFSYTDSMGQDLENTIPGIFFEAIEIETHSAKYDVTLSLSETEQGLYGELEFNTDLFKESTIASMAEHFTSLLEVISEQPDRPVESIALLKTEELYTLLDCSKDEFEAIEPLASTQQDIFLQSLMNENGLQNCMGYLTESNGEFKAEVWYEALELLYQYEPYLRTEFRSSTELLTDIAYQCIRKQRTPNYQFVDLAFEDEPHKAAQEWIKKETYKTYNVTNCDLVSHYVFKIDEEKHYVAAAFHHIMLDGVGGYMLWKKLTFIYNALLDGSIDNKTYEHAEPLFLQYVNEHNQELDHQDVLTFWNLQAEEVEPLNFTLPAYQHDDSHNALRQSSTNPDAKVVQKTLVLDNAQWTEIRQFCRKQRTTPSLYFKAIYGILLKSYCRAEKNFAIGDYIGSRKKQNMYALGCYFEQTPYIFDIEAMSGELKDYLNTVKINQKTVNKYLPVSLSQQNKIFSTSIFRPTYNFYAWPYADEFIGNMQRGITYAPEVAETQLQFIVKAMEEDATLILDYTSNTFAEEFFLQQVKAISDQFISGQTDLSQLQWINEEEKRQQLNDWQSDSIELKHTAVHEMFEQQVLKTPDNIAIRCAGQSMTFKTLNVKANQLGHYLQQQGISRGDQVGICLGRSFEMIIAVLAAIKTGAGYVPMDITYPDERLKYTLSEIDAAMLITNTPMQDKLSFNLEKTFNVDQYLYELDSFSHKNLNAQSQQDDPFYTIFTSGSTGRPKGAAVSHLCEINMLDWYTKTSYQLKENDNVLVMSAFGFDLTQKNIFAPLTTGATLVLPEVNDYDPRMLTQLIEQEKVTWTTCTPSAFFPLVEDSERWFQLDSLEYVFFGGEPLKAEKMKAWKKQSDCQLVNTFGPTECTDIATYHHLEDLENYEHRAIPIGKPNANVKIYILDDDLNLLPAGMTGEICIGGSSVGLGYITQPELTKEKFLADPFSNDPEAVLYKTGDLGRYQDEQGNVEHAGRVDFQLKLRGLRIELGEIEYALQQQECIKEVLVIEHNGQLVAYLTVDNGQVQNLDQTLVKNNLSRFLPQYMIPQHLLVLEHFPLTEHGKIDRKALPEPDLQSATVYHAPETQTQKLLAEIWSKTLDISKIGIDDSFFDLGGHSLIAVKLIAQIEEQFACKLPIVQLMQTPTIADIADYLDNPDQSQQGIESRLVTLQSKGSHTPVFCIHGVGGNIHTFAALAKQIGYERPFHAIQSSGLLENREIQNSISDMMTSYVQEIETISPDGPLILAGHSMGGVIAFEIACYFRQQGREVEQLILLDSPSPRIIKEELRNQGFEWLDENTREQLQAYMDLSFDEEFEQLSFDEKLDYMLAQVKEELLEEDNIVNRTIGVHIANFMAINRFDTHSIYDGDILLLKAESNEGHSLFWDEFTTTESNSIDVKGDHHTMLDAANVDQIAELVRAE